MKLKGRHERSDTNEWKVRAEDEWNEDVGSG